MIVNVFFAQILVSLHVRLAVNVTALSLLKNLLKIIIIHFIMMRFVIFLCRFKIFDGGGLAPWSCQMIDFVK